MPFHEPVLCQAAIGYLLTDSSGMYVDGTVGGGGHAEAICRQLDARGRLICFDADAEALVHARKRLQRFGEVVSFIHANVGLLQNELDVRGIDAVHGILLDLGVSSFQIDTPEKGFSFQTDGRLDMRFDRGQELSGYTVVNEYSETALEHVIREYGEERLSRRIARAITARRPIATTGELRAVVSSVAGGGFLTKSLARVFQALRIEVNAELDNLTKALHGSIMKLIPGGRLVVISYHSLEDRIVKGFFRKESAEVIRSPHAYAPDEERLPALRTLTRKPYVPRIQEVRRNPRARSAKMRAAERLHQPGG
ncbi:MAG: 16S rRNA (cytosine(1402)-N(4))-methyltransferase RsmH [Bacteroidetes bacterium]|nr:16S rRNA (cytosine(1402)-N(4))-methyltransferase RsmH [Bacteroidota bacterium]